MRMKYQRVEIVVLGYLDFTLSCAAVRVLSDKSEGETTQTETVAVV
jgi:hypothetical protein